MEDQKWLEFYVSFLLLWKLLANDYLTQNTNILLVCLKAEEFLGIIYTLELSIVSGRFGFSHLPILFPIHLLAPPGSTF